MNNKHIKSGIILLIIVIIGIIFIGLGESPPLTETGLRIHEFEMLKPIGLCIVCIFCLLLFPFWVGSVCGDFVGNLVNKSKDNTPDD